MTTEVLSLQAAPIFSFGYIIQVFLSLVIVLAFIYFLGRYILPKFKMTNSGKLIKVLDKVYLEPQVSTQIIQVGNSAWLIAISNKRVTRIDKIEKEDLN